MLLPCGLQRHRPCGTPPSRRSTVITAAAKKAKGKGYGTGRARLPGLKDMMLGMDGGMAGASGVESGSESILNVPANEAVSSSDGDSDNAVTGPNLSTYLHFGRLMGETPDMVQRQLDAAGVPVPVDERSQQFIQEWEEEELEQYAMFEAAMSAGSGSVGTSAAAKKLQRNKSVGSATAEAERLRTQVRSEYTRLLAKRAQAGAARPGIRSSISSTPNPAGQRMLAPKPSMPAGLGPKPTRPLSAALVEDEEEDFNFDSAWEEMEAFEAGEAEDQAVALRMQGGAAKPPSGNSSGRVQLKLNKGPISLQTKPQASAAAKEAAQRPLPPPKPKPPTLAAKPMMPAAAEPPGEAPALEAAVAKPKAAAAPTPRAAAPAAMPKPKAAVLKPPPVLAAKPAAKPTAEDEANEPVIAAKAPAKPAQAAAGVKPKDAALAATASPAKAPAKPIKPALPTPLPEPLPVLARPARPQPPRAATAVTLAGKAETGGDPPSERYNNRRSRANAELGAQLLLERTNEVVTVWQVNGAGVLVCNERLSGFIPLTQLSRVRAVEVLDEEQRLLASETPTSEIVAMVEKGDTAAASSTLDPERVRFAYRRQALATVMMGQQITAQVVAVDDVTCRVVLSERAARLDREKLERPVPTLPQLQAASAMVGSIVDATVLAVKPFGCFVEFELDTAPLLQLGPPAWALEANGAGGSGQEGPAVPGGSMLVGLVHRKEVTWDPSTDIFEAVQAGQHVKAQIIYVDIDKSRVSLSIRRTERNPLLETLDSLVGGLVDGSAADAADDDVPGLDQRPTLGDLPEAIRFCEVLREAAGVVVAEPGVRLQSRAAAQELEVYLASGMGSGSAAAAGEPEEVHSYKMLLRKETSVQEVEVVASLRREEVKQLAMDAVAAVASETAVLVQQ